jgi:hypothetical protein
MARTKVMDCPPGDPASDTIRALFRMLPSPWCPVSTIVSCRSGIAAKLKGRSRQRHSPLHCARTAPGQRAYFAVRALRFFFGDCGAAVRALISSASLASRKARRRCMFFRVSADCRSTSAIARAPSSCAKRWRLARATLSGEGPSDFLSLMPHPDLQHESPLNPGIERAALPFQYIREMASQVTPATNPQRLLYRASCRS